MRLFLVGLLAGVLLTPNITLAEESPRLVQRTVVYWALQSSVVLVQMVPSTPPRENAFCGGVVISSDTILTAAHCIAKGRKYFVRAYSGESSAPISSRVCVECDLALVRLEKALPNVRPIAVSTDVAVGDTTYLVGAPDGDAFAVTRGIVSKILPSERFSNCEKGDPTGTKEQDTLMLDARSYFGNSGGPVLDDRANLIGILVRVSAATSSCLYTGEYLIFGLAVGPVAVKAFLDAR